MSYQYPRLKMSEQHIDLNHSFQIVEVRQFEVVRPAYEKSLAPVRETPQPAIVDHPPLVVPDKYDGQPVKLGEPMADEMTALSDGEPREMSSDIRDLPGA